MVARMKSLDRLEILEMLSTKTISGVTKCIPDFDCVLKLLARDTQFVCIEMFNMQFIRMIFFVISFIFHSAFVLFNLFIFFSLFSKYSLFDVMNNHNRPCLRRLVPLFFQKKYILLVVVLLLFVNFVLKYFAHTFTQFYGRDLLK